MSAANTVLGPDAKVTINGTAFAVTEGQYRIIADVPPNDDTLSGAYKTYQTGGLLGLECDITAHKQTDVAPHVAPLSLSPGSSCALILYPSGTANDGYNAATFIVREFSGNFRVANSEPETIRISGVSSGTIVLTTD